ncbi:hypothetical protein OQA88_11070 [Cercophora sp. LCS_1]
MEATTNSLGQVVFSNVADAPWVAQVIGPEGAVGEGSFHTAAQSSVAVTLRSFSLPVAGSDDFSLSNGWSGGTFNSASTRQLGSGTVSTPQVMSKAITLPQGNGARSVLVEYQWQCGESIDTILYTDYFTINMRTNTGSPVEWMSQNVYGMGAGSYDAAKKTGVYTKELRLPASSGVTSLRLDVVAANMRDASGSSTIFINSIGICDQCASCESCPSQARCKAACKSPLANQCSFYAVCAEETMRCGPASYLLAEGHSTCERLRDARKANILSAAANNVILQGERCAQQSIASLLGCGNTCADIDTIAPKEYGTCFTDAGFCALGGFDAARILATLGPAARIGLGRAVASTTGCRETLIATIQGARLAPGLDASRAWALYVAEVFFENVQAS